MDVGLITEPRKFCVFYFSIIIWCAWFRIPRTTSGIRADGSYLGGYGTVYVYGTIHVYGTVYVYGTIHEYGGDGHLYLGDSLL